MNARKEEKTVGRIVPSVLFVVIVFTVMMALSLVSAVYAASGVPHSTAGIEAASPCGTIPGGTIPVCPSAPTNVSTRELVGTGDNVLIGGFIINGSPVTVVVRAIGPSLANASPPVQGALQDPQVRLFSGQTVIAENDNWQTGNCPVEAPNRAPTNIKEACLVKMLAPGNYTAIVNGVGGTTGVGLVEVFYASGDGLLTNISTRGNVQTGDKVLIGGFIIGVTDFLPSKVAVRAIGPSMALPPFNVQGTLQDPVLRLFSGQTEIAQNDNWQTGNCPTEAPNRNPTNPNEACLVITLNPGNYTAIVTGAGGTTGVGLVEVFLVR